tara:strand:- start:1177 stop:1389 length:213 start_codon:yes stop_codon:yes gene_type:complete
MEKELNNIYIVPRYEQKKASIHIYINSDDRNQEGYVLIKEVDVYQILNLIANLCEVSKEMQRDKGITNGN